MPAPVLLGMSLYVWIALISLLFLVVLVALGGFGMDIGGDVDADLDLDYGDFSGPGLSPLSLPLVAAFGTTFGSVGALLDGTSVGDLVTAAIAAASAVLISGSMYWAVSRFLVRQQASTDVRPATLVGRDAQVLVPIGPASQGQILVITDERGRSLFPAIANEQIGRDAIVEITGFTGGVANVRKKRVEGI